MWLWQLPFWRKLPTFASNGYFETSVPDWICLATLLPYVAIETNPSVCNFWDRWHMKLWKLCVAADDGVNLFRSSSNMIRIGAKLCQNAFWAIPDVSSFDAEETCFGANFGSEMSFWLIRCGCRGAVAEQTSNQLLHRILLQIHLSRGLHVQRILDLTNSRNSRSPKQFAPAEKVPLLWGNYFHGTISNPYQNCVHVAKQWFSKHLRNLTDAAASTWDA